MTLQSFAIAPKPGHVPADCVVEFDLYNPPDVGPDFHAAWKRLQDTSPHEIVWTPCNGGHWIALRGKALTDIYNDPETFSNRIILVPRELGEMHKMIPTTMDPPEHRPFRNIINPAFTPKRIQGIEGKIRGIAVDLIEEIRGSGACNFTTAYAEQFPIRIFLALVNLPMTDAPKLKRLSDQIVRPDGSLSYPEIMQTFAQYLAPHIQARRASPGEDLLSDLANASVQGRALTFDESINLISQVLVAGLDTVVNFLGYLMIHLARNPGDRRLLAANREMLPGAVEEFMRRFGLVSVSRLITRDVEFHGAPLKKDDLILLPSLLHGLDERENADPMKVDFTRARRRHSSFGQGTHHCVGSHLARAELRITLEEWLSRIPDFRLAPDATIECVGGIVGCVRAVHLTWDTGSASN
jgi:camphor 5-monooxygenase